jgi:ribosomal-protein-alanine N-acetyltransferase
VTGTPRPDRDGWTLGWVESGQDLEGILEVDRASFSHPWTREMYEQELQNPGVARICALRSPGGRIEGYCSFWLVFDELHINNVAVRPEQRDRGLGTLLVRHALAEGRRLGARKATLEVRRSNARARHLYARLGFQEAGVRRAYYSDPVEDALILWLHDLGPRVADLQNLESNPDA